MERKKRGTDRFERKEPMRCRVYRKETRAKGWRGQKSLDVGYNEKELEKEEKSNVGVNGSRPRQER